MIWPSKASRGLCWTLSSFAARVRLRMFASAIIWNCSAAVRPTDPSLKGLDSTLRPGVSSLRKICRVDRPSASNSAAIAHCSTCHLSNSSSAARRNSWAANFVGHGTTKITLSFGEERRLPSGFSRSRPFVGGIESCLVKAVLEDEAAASTWSVFLHE